MYFYRPRYFTRPLKPWAMESMQKLESCILAEVQWQNGLGLLLTKRQPGSRTETAILLKITCSIGGRYGRT